MQVILSEFYSNALHLRECNLLEILLLPFDGNTYFIELFFVELCQIKVV
jgi:hypothetical protein